MQQTQVSNLINYVQAIIPGMMNSNLEIMLTIFNNWLEHSLYPETARDNLFNLYRHSSHFAN